MKMKLYRACAILRPPVQSVRAVFTGGEILPGPPIADSCESGRPRHARRDEKGPVRRFCTAFWIGERAFGEALVVALGKAAAPSTSEAIRMFT